MKVCLHRLILVQGSQETVTLPYLGTSLLAKTGGPISRPELFGRVPAKDRARVEREGNLLSRAEYEKYLSDVGSRET